MRKIYKIEVPMDRKGHEVRLHMSVKPLAVGNQNGKIVMWYEFTPHPDMNLDERWNVVAVWTGYDFIPYGEYVGTVTVDELVYHVYAGRL